MSHVPAALRPSRGPVPVPPPSASTRATWQQVLTAYHKVIAGELAKRDQRIDRLEVRLRHLEGQKL